MEEKYFVFVHLIISLLAVHFVADFIFQTDWQARNKSKNLQALSRHVLSYGLSLFAFSIVILPLDKALMFVLINTLSHGLLDFVTSKLTSHWFSMGEYHSGFIVVGFDQLVHTVILIMTFSIFYAGVHL